MPRVSEEHLAARRAQIVDAARRCFTRNGFHRTSMQDVLREAELSAGAVYRYFPSKESLIAAIAGQAIATLRDSVADARDRPLREVVLRAVTAVDAHAQVDDVGRLALQVWAEAARSEPLREQIAAAVQEAREVLRLQLEPRHGDAAADLAAFITALLPGYIHARTVVGDMDPERFVRGLDAALAAA